MVSIVGNNAKVYVCISADTKPSKAANGSILVEMDTKKIYMYDETNSQWREQ